MYKGTLKLGGMLMLGSAAANVGKTELACAVIGKFGKAADITAVKVTTIKQRDGQCPRGGRGCGVCSSLEGDFVITKETNSKSNKDTARLLAAGAKQVFWLRVMKTHLKEAVTALLDIVGPDAISVCESNSLRQVVEPGLFLIVKARDTKRWKASAGEVKRYADRVVGADGGGFDFDIDRLRIIDRKWTILEKATAVILAGGGNRRMGSDKGMLPIRNKPMIEHIYRQLNGSFEQVFVSAGEVERYAFLGCDVVRDKIAGQGPLMGIASGLNASTNEINFVVACDIPHIDLTFVRRMLTEAVESQADIVIPAGRDEKFEPLFAVYRKSVLKAVKQVLSSGKRKISDVFPLCRVKFIELQAEQFANLNTMGEYEEFRKRYEAQV
jgi:molybdenum cofactor guanylyltransferase